MSSSVSGVHPLIINPRDKRFFTEIFVRQLKLMSIFLIPDAIKSIRFSGILLLIRDV